MAQYYELIKALHVISMISWMVGLLYMPRVFAYHAKVKVGSEADDIFKTMERRLLRIIMNPAMVLTIVFGLMLAYIYGIIALGVWFHIKMAAVCLMVVFHGLLSRWRKDFAEGKNIHSEKFYRIINEVPSILMAVAVIMVITKPFE